jgi:hypothetical protein
MAEFTRRHPDCAYRAVADEGGLVVLPGRAEVKVLNPAGIKIFSLLDGQHSEAAIARAVADEFDVSEAQALEDVRAFVTELAAAGLLAETEAAAEEAR